MKTYLEIQREERAARESSVRLALKQNDEFQRILAAGVKPNVYTAMVESWGTFPTAEEEAHMLILAALSDAIAITKAEQEGWEIDFYCADRRRLM